jgi:hypothetical protein
MTHSQKHTIFAVDPGLTTGLAWATLEITQNKSISDVLGKARLGTGNMSDDALIKQVRLIHRLFKEVYQIAVFKDQIHTENVHFIVESYVHRQSLKAPDTRHARIPTELAYMLIGYRYGQADMYEQQGLGPTAPITTEFQTAAQAKAFATDQRLKNWGLYQQCRNRHERDAARHLALKVAKLQTKLQTASS